MRKIIYSIRGLFGMKHYQDGKYVGESVDGILPGSQTIYDANGNYIGYSDKTLTGRKTVLYSAPQDPDPLEELDQLNDLFKGHTDGF